MNLKNETEMDQPICEEPEHDADTLLHHVAVMEQLKKTIHSKAKNNIDEAQKKYKKYYDEKHSDNRVSHVHVHLCLKLYGM